MVKRGSAAYCAKCALARDWEDVIAIVQEDTVDIEAVVEVELKGNKKVKKAAKDKEPAAVTADSNGSAAAEDLPADPFA